MDKKQSYENIYAVILVAALITAGYLFMITRSTLWDRDEPRFARSAVEMIESGKYLVPTFNDELWADKPVLVYWLMTVSIKVFGNGEFACRFWSALGTGICSVLTYLIGRRLFGYKQGLLAMGILATSTLMLVIGTMATSDGSTLPFTLGAMLIFIYGLTSKLKQYHIVAIGVLMGFGMLAKGPIGLMPMPVMFLTGWFAKDNFKGFVKNSLLVAESVAIACAVFMVWGLQANVATDGEFLKVFVGRHVLERATKPMEHHGGNFWLYLPYYIPVVIVGFFPWTLFLPGGLSALAGGRLAESKPKKLLLVWTISIIVAMSLAATKLPHYIIFIWPGLALIAAAVIVAFQERRLSVKDIKWLKAGVWFIAPIGAMVGLGMIAGGFYIPLEGLAVPAILCGFIMIAMTIAAGLFVYANKMMGAAKVLIIGMILFHVPHLLGVLPAVEQIKMPVKLAEVIVQETDKDVQVASYKFGEPTLNYYTGRTIHRLSNGDQVVEWLNSDEPRVLVALKSEYDKVIEKYGNLNVTQIGSAKGLDYSKGIEEIELIAVTNRLEIRD